jgi:hypothetical protein
VVTNTSEPTAVATAGLGFASHIHDESGDYDIRLGELETPALTLSAGHGNGRQEPATEVPFLIDPEAFELVFETGIIPDDGGPWTGGLFDGAHSDVPALCDLDFAFLPPLDDA